MNKDDAISLLREVGIYRLFGTDGCLCMHGSVQGIGIDISCRKSMSATDKIAPDFYGVKLRVHSQHLDASAHELEEVATEVRRQLTGEGYEIITRLCDYSADSDQTCVWCGKPRESVASYLCDTCENKPDVAARYGKVATNAKPE